MNVEYIEINNNQMLTNKILFVETFFMEPFLQSGRSIHSHLSFLL